MAFFSKKLVLLLLPLQFSLYHTQKGDYMLPVLGFLGSCAAYYWLKPDRTFATLKQLNIVTFLPVSNSNGNCVARTEKDILKILRKREGLIEINSTIYKLSKGIPEEISNITQPVTLFNCGYPSLPQKVNNMAYRAHIFIKAGLIQGPCVVYDYPHDTRKGVNFCQEQDLHVFGCAYNSLIEKNPQAKIILYGICKSATISLLFLAKNSDHNNFENIKAIIAESPLISFRQILKNFGCDNRFSHALVKMFLPNFNLQPTTIFDAQAFPENIPVLIGNLPHDRITTHTDVTSIVNHLTKLNVHVEHFVSNKSHLKHGRLGQDSDFKTKVIEFLQQHQLRF